MSVLSPLIAAFLDGDGDDEAGDVPDLMTPSWAPDEIRGFDVVEAYSIGVHSALLVDEGGDAWFVKRDGLSDIDVGPMVTNPANVADAVAAWEPDRE